MEIHFYTTTYSSTVQQMEIVGISVIEKAIFLSPYHTALDLGYYPNEDP